MNTAMNSGDHRSRAREALTGQWGTMALLTFLSIIITSVIRAGINMIFSYNSNTAEFVDFILSVFLYFVYQYGIYYASLYVLRGGKAQSSMLFEVFNQKLYVPMLLINIISSVLSFLLSIIVLLPIIASVGVVVAMQFSTGVEQLLSKSSVFFAMDMSSFIILVLVLLLLFMLPLFILTNCYFKFVIWTKMDFPELPLQQCFAYAWKLFKTRIFSCIKLQLSFIGWYLLVIATFGVAALWVSAYVNVATASFYATAVEEEAITSM